MVLITSHEVRNLTPKRISRLFDGSRRPDQELSCECVNQTYHWLVLVLQKVNIENGTTPSTTWRVVGMCMIILDFFLQQKIWKKNICLTKIAKMDQIFAWFVHPTCLEWGHLFPLPWHFVKQFSKMFRTHAPMPCCSFPPNTDTCRQIKIPITQSHSHTQIIFQLTRNVTPICDVIWMVDFWWCKIPITDPIHDLLPDKQNRRKIRLEMNCVLNKSQQNHIQKSTVETNNDCKTMFRDHRS